MAPLRVLVTGAAGQIGYAVVLQIAKGDVFGRDTPVVLVLLDLPSMATVLEGVQYELQDCALANLLGVECVTTEREAFTDIDYAFLVGAMPRKAGMERKDLLAANVKIFKSQGKALADYAKASTKVVVVGNPANTNAYICARYAAPKIPARNFSAMTRLDHNRATAQVWEPMDYCHEDYIRKMGFIQEHGAKKSKDILGNFALAMKAGVSVGDVKNVIIWGNHSNTQYPDVRHAVITKGEVCLSGEKNVDAYSAVNDTTYLRGSFISTVQKRGAVIIQKRKFSSAMSAAKAACDHVRDWHFGTRPGEWVSMAVQSDGSYGIPKGLMFSFPVTIDGATKEWKIVQGLSLDDFAKSKIAITLQVNSRILPVFITDFKTTFVQELEGEREEALRACNAAA
ncbi:malate dehydrogenase [Ostertagia ostertagi]